MFDIPIIINNFNRLTTTRNLVNQLKGLGYTNIHILDNNSTYPPLLKWYKDCGVTVKYLGQNAETQLVLWNSGYINEFKELYPWIVYTDSDIELNPDTPEDFIDNLIGYAKKYGVNKVGLALRLDDIHETNEYNTQAKEWEQQFWTNQLEEGVYKADLDTTFAVLKTTAPFQYGALRVAGNYTARHMTWYTDFDNLDGEERYYLENSGPLSTYKRKYDEIKPKITYMNRWDVINHFIKKYGYKSYLEIGYYKGWSFDQVFCDQKTAVDPNPSKVPEQEELKYGGLMQSTITEENGSVKIQALFKLTSDEFFANITPSSKWDIVFIDGLHEAEQVLRDIKNALDHLNPNGVIILHDCNPPLEAHTTTGIDGCWTGNTYKAAIHAFFNIGNSYTIDTDWGVGVIKPSGDKVNWNTSTSQMISTWEQFDRYRESLLGLISVEDFLFKKEGMSVEKIFE